MPPLTPPILGGEKEVQRVRHLYLLTFMTSMSIKTIILSVVGVIIVLQILVFLRILPGRKAPAPASATLTFWGIDDDSEIWREIIQNFNAKFPTISVMYQYINRNDYEDILVNKIAEGKGPDVFMLPNALFVKNKNKISPLPQASLAFSPRDFSSTFVDGMYEELVSPDGSIYGLPLFIDTPVLFYDKDALNAAGIAQVPTSWEDLTMASRKLTQKNAVGEIMKSGLPLGTSRTIDNSFEILSAIMLQKGDPIIQRAQELESVLGEKGTQAMIFYTSFANPADKNFSWSDRMPRSLTAFAENKSAFAIGFYEDIARIRAKNPHINFGIAPFPQHKGVAVPVVYGRYFFPTVLKFSKNPIAAWQFVHYLTSNEGSDAYTKKTNKPPVRRDLLSKGAPTADLDIFYRQALIAKSWAVPDDAASRRLFQEAIESVVSGTLDASEAVNILNDRLSLLLAK